MAREIGISNIKLVRFQDNSDITDYTAVKYYHDSAINVKYAVSLEVENENATGEYYGDNIIEHSVNQLSKMNVTLEVSSQISPEDDARIRGLTPIKGKVGTGIDANPPYYALMYQVKMDDDTVRNKVIYKVKFTRNSHTNATQEDSVEGQTYTYEGVAVPLTYNKVLDMAMDEAEIMDYIGLPVPPLDADVAEDHLLNFFDRVILPEETRLTHQIPV